VVLSAAMQYALERSQWQTDSMHQERERERERERELALTLLEQSVERHSEQQAQLLAAEGKGQLVAVAAVVGHRTDWSLKPTETAALAADRLMAVEAGQQMDSPPLEQIAAMQRRQRTEPAVE